MIRLAQCARAAVAALCFLVAGGAAAARHHAVLLANHGPVVSGASLAAAADAIEELEATAKLWLLVRRERVRPLTVEEVAEIARRFPR